MATQRKHYIVRDIPAPKNELGQQPRLYNNLPNQAAQQFVAGVAEYLITKPESFDRKVADAAARQIHPDHIARAKAFAAERDASILKLAESMGNPVLTKMLKASYADTVEQADAILTETFKVKDQVYFMAEDAEGNTVEGNGTIYRIDGQTAQVYYPATKTMLTVDVALMSKI